MRKLLPASGDYIRACNEIPFRIFFLKRRVTRRRARSQAGVPQPIDLRDGQELSVMGKAFAIRVEDGAGMTSRARVDNGIVSVRLADSLKGRQRKRHISTLSRKAISNCVLPDLTARVNALNAQHFGFELNGVGIKDQLTRWGSYSKRTNRVYINFRLLFAPDDILDYVILHELAHIRELNHSKDFWRLVGGAVPDFKEKRRWLRKNGNRLGPARKPAQRAPEQIPQDSAPGPTNQRLI